MTPDQVAQAIAFDDGFAAGYKAALAHVPTMEQRDEWIARRLNALQLERGHAQGLIRMVTTTAPYAKRGIPRWVA